MVTIGTVVVVQAAITSGATTTREDLLLILVVEVMEGAIGDVERVEVATIIHVIHSTTMRGKSFTLLSRWKSPNTITILIRDLTGGTVTCHKKENNKTLHMHTPRTTLGIHTRQQS